MSGGSKCLSTNLGFAGCNSRAVIEYMKVHCTAYMFTNAVNPVNPKFVERHLDPPDIKITFDKSVKPNYSQHPLPVGPIHPKSCAESIIKNAVYFLHIFYSPGMSHVSASILFLRNFNLHLFFFVVIFFNLFK